MPQPKDHTQKRGVIETIGRHIPGFRGYLEREYRRDSDKLQRDWLETIANTVRTAIAEGHFKKDVDPEQFAYELYGHMLVGHLGWRLLDDKKSGHRARKAYEALLARSRVQHS